MTSHPKPTTNPHHIHISSGSPPPSIPPDKPVAIGVVLQPHGIRGEIKIHLFNPESEALSCAEALWIRPKGKTTTTRYDITSVRYQHETPLLQLVGCPDRNHAEQLRGADILIDPQELPTLPANEFYMHELEGLSVFHAGTGDPLGTVQQIIPSPAHPLVVVLYQGREVLVPLVEEWVPVIDLDAQRMEISPIPGLFDDQHI